ncbi:MAG: energy transducer TonB, partial [Gemmatimonadota bacterium]|nr:energy transducer TonB [Gemmatimonadota bacterium]
TAGGPKRSAAMLSLFLHGAIGYGALTATMPEESTPDNQTKIDTIIFAPPSPRHTQARTRSSTIRRPLGAEQFVITPTPWPTEVPTRIQRLDLGTDWDLQRWNPVTNTCPVFECYEDNSTEDLNGTFSSMSVDQVPTRISGPPPRYPEMLRQAGMEGWVLLEFVVDTSGAVEPGSVQIVESSNRAFDRPALDMIERSRFSPGRVRGHPVRTMVRQRVGFSLTT